jgi:flagellar biosynthesis protein FlhB
MEDKKKDGMKLNKEGIVGYSKEITSAVIVGVLVTVLSAFFINYFHCCPVKKLT